MPVDCDPVVGFAPDHAPEAMHDVALLADHARFETPPLLTVLGLATKLTVVVGLAVTVTMAD